MGAVFGFVGFLVFITLTTIVNGGVLYLLWEWFMVPLGLKSVSIPHALGISSLITFITHQYIEQEIVLLKLVIRWVLKVAFTLLFAWIFMSLM